jgi:5-formyltetrahydrofolate cyclo-ligase
LVYRPWRGGDPLEPDGCRIPAPLAGAGELPAEALGLLLVPALACDSSGIRLGYGGGWYDRLRADLAWAQVPTVAVLPRGCRVERLPRDPWDVPLQGWLDEDGLAWLDW